MSPVPFPGASPSLFRRKQLHMRPGLGFLTLREEEEEGCGGILAVEAGGEQEQRGADRGLGVPLGWGFDTGGRAHPPLPSDSQDPWDGWRPARHHSLDPQEPWRLTQSLTMAESALLHESCRVRFVAGEVALPPRGGEGTFCLSREIFCPAVAGESFSPRSLLSDTFVWDFPPLSVGLGWDLSLHMNLRYLRMPREGLTRLEVDWVVWPAAGSNCDVR